MLEPRFLAIFVTCVLLVASIFAGFNIAIDPYLLFDVARRPGLNAVKPAVASHEAMMKAYQSQRVRPRTVILGSSRADVGFDPASEVWPQEFRPVYNLSLVGSGTETGLRFLQHMLASNRNVDPPRTLIVGLDFEFFLVRPVAAAKDRQVPVETFDTSAKNGEERLAVLANGETNPDRSLGVWKDYLAGTLSLDAISDSLLTIFANQGWAIPSDIEINGHSSEGRYPHWVEGVGAAALFEQRDVITIRQYNCPHRGLSQTPGASIIELEPVRRLLDFAKSRGMTVFLVIEPSHAMHLDLLGYMGYWQDYENWKRALMATVESASAGGVDVSLWDFGGYEKYARERVPAVSDRSKRTLWFWDSVHSTTSLGDLMVKRMLSRSDGDVDYGARLTPESIERRLAQIRLDRQDYRTLQPDDALFVRNLFNAATKCRDG
jgi:hypothetical protein